MSRSTTRRGTIFEPSVRVNPDGAKSPQHESRSVIDVGKGRSRARTFANGDTTDLFVRHKFSNEVSLFIHKCTGVSVLFLFVVYWLCYCWYHCSLWTRPKNMNTRSFMGNVWRRASWAGEFVVVVLSCLLRLTTLPLSYYFSLLFISYVFNWMFPLSASCICRCFFNVIMLVYQESEFGDHSNWIYINLIPAIYDISLIVLFFTAGHLFHGNLLQHILCVEITLESCCSLIAIGVTVQLSDRVSDERELCIWFVSVPRNKNVNTCIC